MSLALDLTRQRGGDWRGSAGFIPTPGHSKRDRGTIVRDRADGLGVLVYSFNADWRDVRDALGLTPEQARPLSLDERRKLQQQLAREQAEREGRQLARCAELAEAGFAPESDGVVCAYLAARGLPHASVAMAINAGALLEHRDDRGRFSMLAMARNRSGVLRGVQLTKLRRDGGNKRGTDCDRLTFGPYKGAACRLFNLAGETLAVAEGSETALAYSSLRNIPCWATFGAANLAAFDPPTSVRRLIIAADGDTPGLAAAESLFERLRKRLRVIIAAAPAGLDWLDVLNAGGT